MSQDYQTRQSTTEEGNLFWPIRIGHNQHTHTANTRQPKLNSRVTSCSSAIPSSTRGMPFQVQLEECHSLNPYPELNSRDTFRAQLKEHQQPDL